MKNSIVINKRINTFNKIIEVSGDKSISIRWVLFSSIAKGISKAKNLLNSEDVNAALRAIKTLGIKYEQKKNVCKIYGKGVNGYKYRKNLIINAENSGTLGRIILGLVTNTSHPIKIIGDKSLSKRDFKRVTEPLTKFGIKFKLSKGKNLPLIIFGSQKLKSIKYIEKKGSAQCKSTVMLAALNSRGQTIIKAKKSRDHTENIFNHLGIPIIVKKNKNFDIIKVKGQKEFKSFKYKSICSTSS